MSDANHAQVRPQPPLAAIVLILLAIVGSAAAQDSRGGDESEGPPVADRGASAVRGVFAMVLVVSGIAGFAHVLEKKLRKDAQEIRAERAASRINGQFGRIPPPPLPPTKRQPPPVAPPHRPRTAG